MFRVWAAYNMDNYGGDPEISRTIQILKNSGNSHENPLVFRGYVRFKKFCLGASEIRLRSLIVTES